METKWTKGPWSLCYHLESAENDASCPCGYRGVIYGPDRNAPMAICQPGHTPETEGQEGLGPQRYPRDVEIANAKLIAAAPDLYEALAECLEIARRNEGGEYVQRARAALAKARGEAE